MREILEDGVSVGPVKRITSAFSFAADQEFFTKNIRSDGLLEPYGCLGDLGWYNIRLALWVMNEQLPQYVSGRTLSQTGHRKNAPPVPSEFSGELFFESGISSAFYCSFQTHDEQWAVINGAKGYLRLTDFVVPFFGSEVAFDLNNAELKVNGCEFSMESHERRIAIPEYSNSHATSQETNLFRNFAAQVLQGKLNDRWPEIALKTQQVMNACFESAHNGCQPIKLGD
jgi:predicted dehydrogenase